MKVKFFRSYFGPDGNLYAAGIREVPDDLPLPRDAKKVGADATDPEPAPMTQQALSQMGKNPPKGMVDAMKDMAPEKPSDEDDNDEKKPAPAAKK